MEKLEKQEIRFHLVEEIKLSRFYKGLVPRLQESDRQLLEEAIAGCGFDPAHPLVVNEDLLLLDGYTRLEIAGVLKLEWVPVIIRDLGGREAEQEFVILTNLARRQLTVAQRAELGLRLLEIEEKKARERQRAGGEQGRLHRLLLSQVCTNEDGETKESTEAGPETRILPGVGLSNQLDKPGGIITEQEEGRAIKLVAKQVGVSHETLRQAKVISEAAKDNPEVARQWEEAKSGKRKVKTVFTKVKSWRELDKEHEQRIKAEIESYHLPRQELIDSLRETARLKKMPMDAVEALMESDPGFLLVWNYLRVGLVTLTIGWGFLYWKIHLWQRKQQGLESDPEYHRKLCQEMKKSQIMAQLQLAMKLVTVLKMPPALVEVTAGVDYKLLPYLFAWEDRLDLLAAQLEIKNRIKPEIREKVKALMKKGKNLEARRIMTLSVMADVRLKLEREEGEERRRFGNRNQQQSGRS